MALYIIAAACALNTIGLILVARSVRLLAEAVRIIQGYSEDEHEHL